MSELMKPTPTAELAEQKPPHPDMVWIFGGSFLMGSDKHYPEEAPAHEVTVDGFWMDSHTVTNEEFRKFVEATKHVTSAERPPNPDDYFGRGNNKRNEGRGLSEKRGTRSTEQSGVNI